MFSTFVNIERKLRSLFNQRSICDFSFRILFVFVKMKEISIGVDCFFELNFVTYDCRVKDRKKSTTLYIKKLNMYRKVTSK